MIEGKIHPDFPFYTVILLMICVPYQGYSLYLTLSLFGILGKLFKQDEDSDSPGASIR